MEQKITIGVILVTVIGIIIALAILPEIANKGEELTSKISAVNENISIAGAREKGELAINTSNHHTFSVGKPPTTWRKTECPLSSFVLKNTTGDTLTDGTDYFVTLSTGNYSMANVDIINQSIYNDTYASYDYCMTGYITSSAGRSIAGFIVLFSVLGLIAFVIYYAITKSGLIS